MTSPAMAKPRPVSRPAERLICESAMCPQMMAGRNVMNSKKLERPSTKLAMATPEVCGAPPIQACGG